MSCAGTTPNGDCDAILGMEKCPLCEAHRSFRRHERNVYQQQVHHGATEFCRCLQPDKCLYHLNLAVDQDFLQWFPSVWSGTESNVPGCYSFIRILGEAISSTSSHGHAGVHTSGYPKGSSIDAQHGVDSGWSFCQGACFPGWVLCGRSQ